MPDFDQAAGAADAAGEEAVRGLVHSEAAIAQIDGAAAAAGQAAHGLAAILEIEDAGEVTDSDVVEARPPPGPSSSLPALTSVSPV